MRSFSEAETRDSDGQSWMSIPGQVLDSAYELWEFLREEGPRALFRATPLRSAKNSAGFPAGDSSPAGDFNEALFVTLERDMGSQSNDHLKRYLESSFLRDSNLLRSFRAGRARVAGESYVYVVTESADYSLADLLRDRELDREEMRDLTQQLLGGLSYLHAENLVYCALRPESVWRVGKEWKLADFSQLRVNGQRELNPSRLFQSNSEGEFALFAPPEATDGVVTAAWDVWSLGTLLKRAMAKAASANSLGAHGNGSGRALSIPAPFDEIIRGALTADPDQRISLGEVGYRLHKVQWGEAGGSEPVGERASPVGLNAVEEVSREEPVSYPLEAWPLLVEHVESAVVHRSDIESSGRDRAVYQQEQAAHELRSRETYFGSRFGEEPEPESPPRRVLTALLVAIAMAVLLVSGYLFWRNRTNATTQVSNSPAGSETAAPQATAPVSGSLQDPSQGLTGGAPVPDAPVMPPASGKKTAMEVLDLLGRWTDSAKTRDITGQMLCYAPRVDRYFDRRNVGSDDLKRVKEDEFDTLGPASRVNVSQIAFKRVTPDWVVVSFSKVVTSPGRRTRATQEEIVVRQYEGRWRISSESSGTSTKLERPRRRGRGQR